MSGGAPGRPEPRATPSEVRWPTLASGVPT